MSANIKRLGVGVVAILALVLGTSSVWAHGHGGGGHGGGGHGGGHGGGFHGGGFHGGGGHYVGHHGGYYGGHRGYYGGGWGGGYRNYGYGGWGNNYGYRNYGGYNNYYRGYGLGYRGYGVGYRGYGLGYGGYGLGYGGYGLGYGGYGNYGYPYNSYYYPNYYGGGYGGYNTGYGGYNGCSYNSSQPVYYTNYGTTYPTNYGYGYPSYGLGQYGSAPATTVYSNTTLIASQPITTNPTIVNAGLPTVGATRIVDLIVNNSRPITRTSIVDKIMPKDSRSMSDQYVTTGDRLFAQHRYHEAYDQYKRATSFASDSAHVYFREGMALVATKRYDQAVTAFRNGLSADPDYVSSRFRADDLYAGSLGQKAEHLDGLAAAAMAKPDDGSLLFALGVMLHFDGQADRAQKFFAKASNLSPVNERYARSFMNARPLVMTADRAGVSGRDL